MKRIVSMLLAVCMCLSIGVMLTACGDEEHTHTYQTEWSKDATHHWHACEGDKVDRGCDDVADKAEHTWNDGEITTEATAEADGIKTFTCTVCFQTKTETLKYSYTITKEEWLTCLTSDNFTMTMYIDDTVIYTYYWDGSTVLVLDADGNLKGGSTVEYPIPNFKNLGSFIFYGGDWETHYSELTYDETAKKYIFICKEYDDDIEYYHFYCESGKISKLVIKNNEFDSADGTAVYVFSHWGETTVDISDYLGNE